MRAQNSRIENNESRGRPQAQCFQVVTELFSQATGISARHVPYKGLAPAMNDLLGGQIDFIIDSGTAVPHVKAGRLVALAAIGTHRLKALPDVPLLSEQGYRGPEAAMGWHGLFASAQTPPDVVRRLNEEVNAVLATPAVKERIEAIGVEPVSSTPAQLASRIDRERQTFAPIVTRLGLVVD